MISIRAVCSLATVMVDQMSRSWKTAMLTYISSDKQTKLTLIDLLMKMSVNARIWAGPKAGFFGRRGQLVQGKQRQIVP
jgi:hypothetical protein